MKDPYKVLGVPQGVSAAALKSAYRTLAKELHPDVNAGDTLIEQRFKEVSAAYDLLSNTQKRQQYDNGQINADGSPRAENVFGQRSGGMEFEDLVADLFGRRRPRQARGKSITYSVSVPFIESVLGGVRRIRLHDGKTLEVNIPPATEDGANLRLKGQGMAGMGGGPVGDALVEVQIEPHPYFTRDGLDIRVDVPITLAEAVLGAKINIPTIHGPVSVRIPAGTNTGKILRLKGRGVVTDKTASAAKGDAYVHLTVTLPDTADAKLKNFLRDWTKQGDYDVRKKAGLE
jgi:DnaJ-class molecular chaperone